jgi:hypothetical protein
MKKLRILQVSFDTEIQPYQLPAFRGAVAHKVGLEHHWFHNHDNENGTTFNRYPLIQYKLDTHKGQMRPMLLCLEEGIEEAHHLFSQPEWSLNIKGTQHDLRIAHLHVNQYTLNTWDTVFRYRLHKWQPFHIDNYREYQGMESLTEKNMYIEQRLTTNINSFAEGVGWKQSDTPITVNITNMIKTEWIEFKRLKVLAFTLDFNSNFSLPDFVGLGKGVSKGFGVVRRERKVK